MVVNDYITRLHYTFIEFDTKIQQEGPQLQQVLLLTTSSTIGCHHDVLVGPYHVYHASLSEVDASPVTVVMHQAIVMHQPWI